MPDRPLIHRFLSERTYWSPGVPREIVERAIDNSLCFGVYRASAQIGFARVVTDFATFAWLADVFILEEERGKGLSKNWWRRFWRIHDCRGFDVFCWGRSTHTDFTRNLVSRPLRIRSGLWIFTVPMCIRNPRSNEYECPFSFIPLQV